MKTKEMQRSTQFELIRAAYESDKEGVEARIISLADEALSNPDYRDSSGWTQLAYTHLFNEGSFDPFIGGTVKECLRYGEMIGELGNDDDEIDYLNKIWVYTLSKTDIVKYAPIIMTMMDIAVNGL